MNFSIFAEERHFYHYDQRIMFEKSKLYLCVLVIVFSTLLTSSLHAQLTRLLGAGGLVLDSRSQPYLAVTIFAPQTLTTSYSLAFPPVPPNGALSFLASDANGIMSWNGSIPLPPLPKGNIWVGNAIGVATPYAPTTPGSILTLDALGNPSWSTSLPSSSTLSVSQLTTGTLQPGVTFNVGTNSIVTTTGGTIAANNLNGAGVGNYAGNVPIPINASGMNIAYSGVKPGASVTLTLSDPNGGGVSVYLVSITPGVGFSVAFSVAHYFTNTGVISYIVINP
jgi:hypothetical protein